MPASPPPNRIFWPLALGAALAAWVAVYAILTGAIALARWVQVIS